MKTILVILLFTTNLINGQTVKNANNVSFIITFDINKATKDGYYVGDYIININSEKAIKLDGKKIKITGKFQIVKGLKHKPKKYDKKRKSNF